MNIRKALSRDLERIFEIYDGARSFMRASGNPDQWKNGYPDSATVLNDIACGRLFVCEENGELLAVFCFFKGRESDYEYIEGSWLDSTDDGVIHRIAVSDKARGRGVASLCFGWCKQQCESIKIDTHRLNIPMQKALEKNGFVRCGIIYLQNGEERIGYQYFAGAK